MLIPSLFFVTNQSLWVDEANSAWFADHAQGLNPGQFEGLAAVPEMPAFHVLLVGWVRVFGNSERALRAINVPFAALFLGSLLVLCRYGSARVWWLPAAPFALFPLMTYYVNECRPYTALLGLSTAAACGLIVYSRTGGRKAVWVCCVCCLGAFSMHLFGIFLMLGLGLFVLAGASLRRRMWDDRKNWIAPLTVLCAGCVALGLYYVQVGRINISASHVNSITPSSVASNWKNVVFFFYETLGFAGLGPPRNDLRLNAGVHSFYGYVVTMLVGAVAGIAIGVCLMKARRSAAVRLLTCSMCVLVVFFVFARAFHFGFFGRHGMPLVGLVCCSVVLALSGRDVSDRMQHVVVAVLVLAWGWSSARLLFVYPYAKDDVRTALRVAGEPGLPILWNAGDRDLAYYGGFDVWGYGQRITAVSPSTATAHWHTVTAVHMLPNARGDEVGRFTSRLSAGRYVLVKGKADVFDASGSWDAAMLGWQPRLLNRLNGYDVWQVTLPARGSSAAQ